MGSEIQSERANAQDVRDVQDAYRKRRKEVEEEGHTELVKARKDNQVRLKNENEAGEAAINHVRAATEQEIEKARADNELRLTYERKNLTKTYQNTKETGKEVLENLDNQLVAKENEMHKETERVLHHEDDLRAKESREASLFSQEEAQRQAKALASEQDQLNQVHQKVEFRKNEANERGKKELQQTNEKESPGYPTSADRRPRRGQPAN